MGHEGKDEAVLTNHVTAAVQLVATHGLVPMQDRPPPPGQLPEWGNAAPVGLAIVLVLLVATAFLIRNMSKRLKRLPDSFEEGGRESPETDGGADPRGT